MLAALSLPASALGQAAAPTLKEARDSGFPDRQYLLLLPSPRTLELGDVTITENGGPISGQVGVEARDRETGPSREYLVTYRSLLPPGVPAEVRASVEGLPAATARYATPELVVPPLGAFAEDSSDGLDTPRLLVFVLLLSTLALWVVARVRRP